MVTMSISLAIQAISWWYVASKIHPTNDSLFLHYNIIFSIDLIGEWWKVYTPSFVGLVLLLVNLLVGWLLYGNYRVMSRVLLVFMILIEAALLVGQVLLVNLNV